MQHLLVEDLVDGRGGEAQSTHYPADRVLISRNHPVSILPNITVT